VQRRYIVRATSVKELMVPFTLCATVSEDASLHEAVLAFEASRQRCDRWDYRFRIILVYDKQFRVVGTLRQFEVLKGLEKSTGQSKLVDNQIWGNILRDICDLAKHLKVRDIMTVPTDEEYISEDADLTVAVHRMLKGNFLSLMVNGEKGFVGIIRLSDIFREVCEDIKSCGTD
jgi:CBS domain-containing protein